MKKLNHDIIMKTLSEKAQCLSESYNVNRIGIFGFYARKEARDKSDIDILMDFSDPAFDNYMDCKFYLEGLFSAPVDLVMIDSIKPRLKDRILREVCFASRL